MVTGGRIVFLLQRRTNINRCKTPAAFGLQLQDEAYLTIVVDSEGHIGSDDVIEANLAVLRGAIGIQSLHAHDSVKQTPFWDRSLVATINEHGGELIDVVHTNVHGGPEGSRSGKQDTSRERRIIVTTGRRNGWIVFTAHSQRKPQIVSVIIVKNTKYLLFELEGEGGVGTNL